MNKVEERNIEERVHGIIREHMRVEDVKNKMTIVDDIGADSLDVVELVMAVEEEFNMEVSDHDAEKMKTVQDIINHVRKEDE